MSYKIMFEFSGQPDAGNAQRFATENEARESALNRFMRWTMPTGFHIEESEDSVNYAWVAGIGDKALN
jgi:hypothetical protein